MDIIDIANKLQAIVRERTTNQANYIESLESTQTMSMFFTRALCQIRFATVRGCRPVRHSKDLNDDEPIFFAMISVFKWALKT